MSRGTCTRRKFHTAKSGILVNSWVCCCSGANRSTLVRSCVQTLYIRLHDDSTALDFSRDKTDYPLLPKMLFSN